MRAALLTFVDLPCHHRISPLRKSCALVTPVSFALHLKNNDRVLITNGEMASYKQFGFL